MRPDALFELGECAVELGLELLEIDEAFVVRTHGEETAVEFDHCVTFDRMVKEQMEVIRNSFPEREVEEEEAEALVSTPNRPARPHPKKKLIRFSQLRRLHND